MDRRTSCPGEVDRPDVELVDGVWHVRSLPLVREVLRDGARTRQAGFAAEVVRSSTPLTRFPVLYADGPEHQAQRAKIGRYFAPVTVRRRYLDQMRERAREMCAVLAEGAEVDLSGVTLHYSAQTAARVIGLTDSPPDGMARRLVGFFDQPEGVLTPAPSGLARLTSALAALPGLVKLARLYLLDVRPAIRARRRERQEDVISHLLDEGYSDLEIVMECLTYGAAGMVTTREFLQVAAWHLLTDPELRADWRDGDEARRSAILHEMLRLEPVVGHLHRRAAEDLVLTDAAGREHVIPSGARLDLYVRSANADPDLVGPDALELCPGRELPRGIRPEVMSFGDGPHRCPGNAIAMAESEIFLTALLAHDPRIVHEPSLEWEEIVEGYAIRGLVLSAGPQGPADEAGRATEQ